MTAVSRPDVALLTSIKDLDAIRAREIARCSGTKKVRKEKAEKVARRESLEVAQRNKAESEALGIPFAGDVGVPGEVGLLTQEIASQDAAIAMSVDLAKTLQAAELKAEAAVRVAEGRQLQRDLVPPLIAAAQISCAAAVRDLVALAAIEDRIINRLQARLPMQYLPGNAATFLMGMARSGAINVFCDLGTGVNAWSIPGYEERSLEAEGIVLALEAAAREAEA